MNITTIQTERVIAGKCKHTTTHTFALNSDLFMVEVDSTDINKPRYHVSYRSARHGHWLEYEFVSIPPIATRLLKRFDTEVSTAQLSRLFNTFAT